MIFFKLINQPNLTFNIHTSNNKLLHKCSFDYLMNYLNNHIEASYKSYYKFINRLRIKYEKELNLNPTLTWYQFRINSGYCPRLEKGHYILSNSYKELESEEGCFWDFPKIMVTDDFGRIIDIKYLCSNIEEIYRKYYRSKNHIDLEFNAPIIGKFNVIEIPVITLPRDKKITPDIISKHIENDDINFKIISNHRFSKIKHIPAVRFRKDPIPGIHHYSSANYYGSKKMGLLKEYSVFYDKDIKKFCRSKRKKNLLYVLDRGYHCSYYGWHVNWKYSGKYNKQWEKNSVKKNLKNSLYSIDGYFVNSKDMEDKEYYDYMLKWTIINLGTNKEKFERMCEMYD